MVNAMFIGAEGEVLPVLFELQSVSWSELLS
jgi:hypothetical protein